MENRVVVTKEQERAGVEFGKRIKPIVESEIASGTPPAMVALILIATSKALSEKHDCMEDWAEIMESFKKKP